MVPRVVRERHKVQARKAIKQGQENFNNRIRFRVGNEWIVKFWKDKWCGKISLVNAFSAMFSIVVTKET